MSLADDGLQFNDLIHVLQGLFCGVERQLCREQAKEQDRLGLFRESGQGTSVTVGSGPTAAAFWRMGRET